MDGSRGPIRPSASGWRQSLAAAIWTSLILLTAVLYSQKFAGGIPPATSPVLACFVATLTTVPSLLAWTLCAPLGARRVQTSVRFQAGAVTLVAPLAASLVFLPTTSGFAHWYVASLSAAASILVVVSSNSDLLSAASRRKSVSRTSYAIHASDTGNAEFPSALAGEGWGGGDGQLFAIKAAEITPVYDEPILVFQPDSRTAAFSQQLTRTISPTHGDVLEGSVTVYFEPGRRQANVHIPFMPPFSSIPATECEALDGCDVRLKLGTVQTFGLRIEARRTGDCNAAETAEVGFSAVVGGNQADVAA